MSHYYSGTSGLGIGSLGQAADSVTPVPTPGTTGTSVTTVGPLTKLLALGSTLSIPVLAWHGYKRNNSMFWGAMWGFLGSGVWPVMVPIAFAQGFAKRKVGSNPRRRRVAPNRRRTSRPRRRTSRSRR